MSNDTSKQCANLPATVQQAAKPPTAPLTKASPALRLKIDEKTPRTLRISLENPDQASGLRGLMNAVGTANPEFADAMLRDIAGIGAAGPEQSAATLTSAFAMVQAIAPRDETEAMLATQMVAIHNATIKAARHLEAAATRPQSDSYSNALNKLARTFAAQMETLKRYRSTGEQSIKVQHVTVNEGGQAVVGLLTTGGGAPQKLGGQSHGPRPSSADERGTTLLGHVQALEATLPGASREGIQGLPVSRRKGRSPERES